MSEEIVNNVETEGCEQCKKLEQENQELRTNLEKYCDFHNNFVKEAQKTFEENVKLKEEIKELKNEIKNLNSVNEEVEKETVYD